MRSSSQVCDVDVAARNNPRMHMCDSLLHFYVRFTVELFNMMTANNLFAARRVPNARKVWNRIQLQRFSIVHFSARCSVLGQRIFQGQAFTQLAWRCPKSSSRSFIFTYVLFCCCWDFYFSHLEWKLAFAIFTLYITHGPKKHRRRRRQWTRRNNKINVS